MVMDAGVLRLRRAVFELGAGGRNADGIIIVVIIVIIQTKSIHERDPLFTDFVTSIPSPGTGNLYNSRPC